MLIRVAVAHKSLADYTHIVGRELIEEIRAPAAPLRDTRIVHLDATAYLTPRYLRDYLRIFTEVL